MTPDDLRKVMRADPGPPGIADAGTFASLMFGFVAAVVVLYKPEQRLQVASEYGALVRCFALSRGKALSELGFPAPRVQFASPHSVAGFLGALLMHSQGADSMVDEAFRTLASEAVWEKMMPVLADPEAMAKSTFGVQGSKQLGLRVLGIVGEKKDPAS